jgi:hypothetical protein
MERWGVMRDKLSGSRVVPDKVSISRPALQGKSLDKTNREDEAGCKENA